MNRNDVIDVLTVVAAATRRTVGEADVAIWEGIIGELDKDLALRAVRDHLKFRPGVWLEPGHVYEGARAIRRDQLDREPRWEWKSVETREEVAELADRKGLLEPSPRYVRRPQPAEMKVKCPWCNAQPGRRCVIPQTDHELTKTPFHDLRVQAAKAQS